MHFLVLCVIDFQWVDVFCLCNGHDNGGRIANVKRILISLLCVCVCSRPLTATRINIVTKLSVAWQWTLEVIK